MIVMLIVVGSDCSSGCGVCVEKSREHVGVEERIAEARHVVQIVVEVAIAEAHSLWQQQLWRVVDE